MNPIDTIKRLINRITGASDEIDRLRAQLAGCGVAALGGIREPLIIHKGDFGWSPSYQDTLDLRRKYDKQKTEIARMARVRDHLATLTPIIPGSWRVINEWIDKLRLLLHTDYPEE